MKQITLQIKVIILLIFFILPCNTSASEKPEIFVQLAKESIIYCSGLKFMQEAQA